MDRKTVRILQSYPLLTATSICINLMSMRRIIISLVFICVMLVGPELKAGSRSNSIPQYMYNASNTFHIDLALLYAICKVESNCKPAAINPYDSNESQKSRGIVEKSYGLFQLKLATAKSLGFVDKEIIVKTVVMKHRSRLTRKIIWHNDDLLKPEINSWYAAKLLRHLYDKYHNTDKVISAYNAGHYITTNSIYVHKVLSHYANYKIDKRF